MGICRDKEISLTYGEESFVTIYVLAADNGLDRDGTRKRALQRCG